MSLRATLWVLDEAPTTDMRHFAVLVALADVADDGGRGCWPAVRTLARRARCSERTVQRILREMEDAGLIRRGNQILAEGIRADRRPVVYDLCMPSRGDNLSPRSPHGVTDGASRGDKPGTDGVTRLSPDPKVLNRSMNRGERTCSLHLLSEPCRGCAADRLVTEADS